jgi:spore germination protein KA
MLIKGGITTDNTSESRSSRKSGAKYFYIRRCPERAVGILETEVTVRGPREGFIETLGTNIALLRRRINHPDLMIETFKIGRKTRTNVNVVYLKGIVNDQVVKEIKLRLERIQTDGILGAGHIEQFIGDAPWSPFSTVGYSERPDVVAAKILEGRAAIVIDGNPEVLTVPFLFIESFQNSDDYNTHPFYATLIRWIRYIAFGISILGPAAYIAAASYNQELIPTPLFINIAGAEGTPYPTFVEVIVIGLLFEIFREAGIRLPKPFGQGITFVMALVLAQVSVNLGIAGVATVVVVTITAIASFVVPSQANSGILIRLALVILASLSGAYGILLGLLWVLAHVVSLRSFGAPYLAPLAPFSFRDFKQDTVLRIPLWAMLFRPRTIGWHNEQRQAKGLQPTPPADINDNRREHRGEDDKK